MDRIPLINPKLIKVSAPAERAPASVLRAEVISSTPVKEPRGSQGQNPTQKDTPNKDSAQEGSSKRETAQKDGGPQNAKQQEYRVVLKVGQQELETISNNDFKKGTLLEVKISSGPELKIINSDQKIPLATQTAIPQAKALVQQLLADRIPQIQQQELPNLIKQLSQIISLPVNSSSQATSSTPATSPLLASPQASTPASAVVNENSLLRSGHDNTYSATEAKPTNQQTLANQLYLQQGKSILSETGTANTSNTISSTAVQQAKIWLQQLPKEQDISNSTGLRNALNSTGIQAEKQLSNLAQQSVNLADKKSANTIFQQLQSLQKSIPKEQPPANNAVNSLTNESTKGLGNDTAGQRADLKSGLQNDLASIVKRTAKVLSDNSQSILSSLVKSGGIQTSTTKSTAASPVLAPSASNQPAITASQWQNPLLNNSLLSLDDLLNSPLLQNPSSNNKFALSQILTGHTLAGQSDQFEGGLRIPLNWPERTGTDAALIRNLQNLLGHIEREQIQQMQSTEANQGNNPNQLQLSQQWVPLLINYQQQLQLIEFYMDKEERLNKEGEKKNHWFINLHFDLPKLGRLGIEISMFDNECNTTFWSESSSALNQLSQHIQPLRERLTEQGIIVSDIQSRHGTLEKRKHNIQQRLVDIKT
jgi:hypothetical protein